MLSILIPSYKFLRGINAILDVLNNSNSFSFEVIVMDDSPNYEIFQPNIRMGLSHILNKGIELSKNEWIIRADGDDINLVNRFQILSKLMKQNYDLIGSHVIEYDRVKKIKKIKKIPLTYNEIKSFSKIRNPFNHMSVAYKKSIVTKLGLYPHLYLKEDYGLWIKFISNRYRIINIPEALVEVSANNEMYSRRGGLKYIKSEIELFTFKNKYKIHSPLEGSYILLMRLLFLLIPNFLKLVIYKYFLRRSY